MLVYETHRILKWSWQIIRIPPSGYGKYCSSVELPDLHHTTSLPERHVEVQPPVAGRRRGLRHGGRRLRLSLPFFLLLAGNGLHGVFRRRIRRQRLGHLRHQGWLIRVEGIQCEGFDEYI